MSQWTDLTQPIHENIPTRPLHEAPSFEDNMILEKDGANSTICHIESHVGTHMDSPAHFLSASDRRTIDEFTADEMVGEGVVLNFAHKQSGSAVTREELETEAAGYGIASGDYAILKLNMDPRDDDEYLMDYVYPTDGVVEYLLEKGISCFATEALNMDKSQQSLEEHTVHYNLLKHDVFIVEGLTNLDDVDGGRYDVVCTPLPYVGRNGSQVRFLIRPR